MMAQRSLVLYNILCLMRGSLLDRGPEASKRGAVIPLLCILYFRPTRAEASLLPNLRLINQTSSDVGA